LAEWLLEQEGMTGLFKVICGSSSEGNNNAKWQVLQRAMDALGATADNSVLVGDTKYDVEGAKRCGVSCIGVRYGYAAPGELENAGAVAIAENMDELLQLLTK
jgi:phosphoglycolate phosphatase